MKINRQTLVVGGLLLWVLASAATIAPLAGNEFKNLRVLPKDISNKELQRIMVDEFQDGLGVTCGYCHVKEKGSLHFDYASDEKPEKEIARAMIQMTLDINKKYFNAADDSIVNVIRSVNCSTCHQGTAHPETGSEK